MSKMAGNIAQKLLIDKAKGEIKDKVMKEVMSDAVGEAANKTFKSAFGYATLFISFVDTYSKAVKAACLEHVRRDLEVCPHIGGCENYGHAIKMACSTTSTVWLAPDAYWYFHPQPNYLVRHARQILRSTEDGGYRIEQPGKSKLTTCGCLGCYEAHKDFVIGN